MENVVISKLKMADLKEAARLITILANDTLDRRKDIFLPLYENWEENLTERMNSKDFEVIVAKIGDKVVGACSAEIKHIGDDKITKVRHVLFIEYIIVDDEYKRNKIGSKMLDYMKKFAKDNNIPSLELTVWGYNKSAINFYEDNNMKIKRTIYEYKMDGEE